MKVVERGVGNGPSVLLVHGSAADHTTWGMQLAGLHRELHMIAWDRREELTRVEEHAADAAALIEERAGGQPVLACGSSFGAVVVLALLRARPDLVRRAILCEPPLACADGVPAVPAGFGCHFDALVAQSGGPSAAAFFLITVLGRAAYERMPGAVRERCLLRWRAIRNDSLALAAYVVDYRSLLRVQVPVELVAGERSQQIYRPTIDALARALAHTRQRTIEGAGHMMHLERHAVFSRMLIDLAIA